MEKKKIYAPSDLMPFEPIHPGEMLKDELQARGITQKMFARIIGISYTMLNEVLNSKRPISLEVAFGIEAALGIRGKMWIDLQSDYDYQVACKDQRLSARLQEIRKMCASLL